MCLLDIVVLLYSLNSLSIFKTRDLKLFPSKCNAYVFSGVASNNSVNRPYSVVTFLVYLVTLLQYCCKICIHTVSPLISEM